MGREGSELLPVLIVEDDGDTRDAMRSLLEFDGYPVFTAGDGTEALEWLRSGFRPGIILLDLMMPGMDGFEFVNEQRQDPQLSSIPVIVYSGHYDAESNAARLGVKAYFRKPIYIDAFLTLVGTHCVQPQAAH
jgi:CheY-like chemotaxis protein